MDREVEIHPGDALTPIHRRIHCGATTGTTESNEDLEGIIAVDQFLGTLAEVALAIARWREQLAS